MGKIKTTSHMSYNAKVDTKTGYDGKYLNNHCTVYVIII